MFCVLTLDKTSPFIILNFILVSLLPFHQNSDILFIKMEPVLGFFKAKQAIRESPLWAPKLTPHRHTIRLIPSVRDSLDCWNHCTTAVLTSPSDQNLLMNWKLFERKWSLHNPKKLLTNHCPDSWCCSRESLDYKSEELSLQPTSLLQSFITHFHSRNFCLMFLLLLLYGNGEVVACMW
jgi:hypothetical protein